MSKEKKRFVFLDRDGVINEDRCDYIGSWEEFAFLPKAKEGLALLNEAGYGVVIISNQAGIGKGKVSRINVVDINRRMVGEIEETGGKIHGVYICPHRPDEDCRCRKPQTGMLKEAVKKFNIDVKESFFVGDSPSDIEAGRRLGCRTILIESEKVAAETIAALKPGWKVTSLREAAEVILREPKKKKKK